MTTKAEDETHPVQLECCLGRGRVPAKVTLAAYEVYRELFGEQEALVTGDCRGGFGTGELIAFLYARSFQRADWRHRFHEALEGMELRRP